MWESEKKVKRHDGEVTLTHNSWESGHVIARIPRSCRLKEYVTTLPCIEHLPVLEPLDPSEERHENPQYNDVAPRLYPIDGWAKDPIRLEKKGERWLER